MSRFGGIPVEEEKPKNRFGGTPVEVEDAPVPAPKSKPNILKRSIDNLQLGLSDAMSTLSGDSFGRAGDPTQRDFQDSSIAQPRRLLKAMGGDILGSVGDVTGDAIATGIQQLPQGAQEAIGKGVNYVAESAPAQMVGQGLDAWRAADPESYATAGELGNVLTAALPIKGIKPKFGSNATSKLKNAIENKRKLETQRLILPDDVKGADLVEEAGGLKTVVAKPREELAARIETVSDVKGVDPRGSNTKNITAIEKETDNIRSALDKKLEGTGQVDINDVEYGIEQAIDRTAGEFVMSGDTVEASNRIYDKLQSIIQEKAYTKANNGKLSAKDLLDARREVDDWLKKSPGDYFGPEANAKTVATREIRNTLNDMVAQLAPDANVKDDLKKMNRLLTARDTLFPRSIPELDTNFISRYLNNLERRTGVSHPATPLAIAANVRSPAAAALAIGAAGSLGIADAAAGGIARNSAAFQRALAEGIRGTQSTAAKAAALAATNKDEEENY